MPFRAHSDGVTINVRLTPGAKKAGLQGIMDIGDGETAFKISVRSVPEDGKANKELLSFIADELNLPKAHVSLLKGVTSRLKTILIQGDTKNLMLRLAAWRNEAG